MTGNDVRRKFLEFFEERGHARVRSSSLIPSGDSTLLFANAGMNQFKDLFLGRETRPYRRATTAQKCLRVSGKHNDFDQVGRTARHHTFFEMLGNFSFGDYFKQDAIAYAWELVTGVYGMKRDRLWVTVFREDDDAERIWRDVAGVEPSRIVRMDEKDNFWAMGDTGPCGPCSEIYFDQGASVGCGKASCSVACGCDRYLEFWNLVFMQYERQADGSMQPLAAPSIDTGAGLERLSAILQGVESNYRCDLFTPILDEIAARAGVRYGKEEATDVSLQVIADHLRAMSFLVADGVVPSNEKRGYILRRIIRRALTYGLNLGLQAPFLHALTGRVGSLMGAAYPELAREQARIDEVTRREEETFRASLDRGFAAMAPIFEKYAGTVLPAREVVGVSTTYGVMPEIQAARAIQYHIAMPPQAEIDAEMEKHREAARASWKESKAPEWPADLLALPRDPGFRKTVFTGYSGLSNHDARIVALADAAGLRDALAEGQSGFIVLDRTPFYAESGGQVGDTGRLRGADGSEAEVEDAQSPVPGMTVHLVTVRSGSFGRDDVVTASVDSQTRAATMRNHTATHLLHASLKRVLGPQVQQAGSYVGPDRLRFDFNWHAAVTREQLDRVEDEVNDQILRNIPVTKVEQNFDEAIASGAMALFGEKYGERVRVVSVPGYSQELCGGTHCSGTGDIGLLRVVSERGIAAGVRRIEALTGVPALDRAREDARTVEGASELLHVQRESVVDALVNALAVQKTQARELEKLKLKVAQLELRAGDASAAGPGARQAAGVSFVARRVEGLDRAALRTLSDNLKREIGSGVVVLAGLTEGKASLLVTLTPDLKETLDARALVRELAPIIGGGGGGNPTLAEAGGKDPSRIDEMLGAVEGALTRAVAAATGSRER